jgi:hypothetical protein
MCIGVLNAARSASLRRESHMPVVPAMTSRASGAEGSGSQAAKMTSARCWLQTDTSMQRIPVRARCTSCEGALRVCQCFTLAGTLIPSQSHTGNNSVATAPSTAAQSIRWVGYLGTV